MTERARSAGSARTVEGFSGARLRLLRKAGITLSEQQLEAAANTRGRGIFSGEELRRLRTQKVVLTQEELGKAMLALTGHGVSRGELSHLENGRRQPLVKTLAALCEVLGCEPGELMQGPDKEESNAPEERKAS
jgi:DNA-binding Xre family transcriptional regulator